MGLRHYHRHVTVTFGSFYHPVGMKVNVVAPYAGRVDLYAWHVGRFGVGDQ